MVRTRAHLLAIFWIFCGTGCEGGEGPPDNLRDAGPVCTRSAECDDGVFCNGAETCAPSSLVADAVGCVPGVAPCVAACDEQNARCEGACTEGDRDGDGHESIECGGDDCDDTDPNRYPGNVETCDAQGRDEDCDPSTLGSDIDRDGFVDDRCCGPGEGDSLVCGLDCDDLRDSVSPSAIESCNGVDDDCDGDIDEDPQLVFYRDADGDGFGVDGDPDDMGIDPAIRPIRACAPPSGYVLLAGDCDDAAPTAHIGSPEFCDDNGVDEDCDGQVDEYGGGALTPAVNPIVFYRDADGDGYGVADEIALGCRPPTGFASVPGDCRDDRPGVHPNHGFERSPSCPRDLRGSDTVTAVDAVSCPGGWECLPRGQSCGAVFEDVRGIAFDAVWDLDCSGVVEAPSRPGCVTWSPTECDIFQWSQDVPATGCGVDTFFYLSYTGCEFNEADQCVEVGSGGLGFKACR